VPVITGAETFVIVKAGMMLAVGALAEAQLVPPKFVAITEDSRTFPTSAATGT
jgi:hypothetical protein